MRIRSERQKDIQQIRHINVQAFDTEAEADIIEALRNSGISLISLVAEERGELVGHILFSPVTLGNENTSPSIAGLAPMAVVPECQNKGIGSRLWLSGDIIGFLRVQRCNEREDHFGVEWWKR